VGAVAWRDTDILSNKQAISRSSSLLAAALHVDILAVDSHQLVPITPMFPLLTSRCHQPRRPAPRPYMPDSMIRFEYWPNARLSTVRAGALDSFMGRLQCYRTP
jgi:hypothetical protein